MSEHAQIDAAIEETKASLSKSKEKKKQKVFGFFKVRGAVSSRKEADSQASRKLTLDVSDAAEKALGGLRQELATAARFLRLEPPLLDQFQATFEIEVTTGAAIWQAIENNRFWEEAQLEAVRYASDEIAPKHLDLIRNRGVKLRKELVDWANVVGIVKTELPADVAKALEGETTGFVASIEKDKNRMIRHIQKGSAEYLVNFMKQQLKLEKDIIKYKAGKSGIVIINLGLIAGHIAHMAASFGATSPLAIVAIIRLSVEIGQIAEKALNDLEGIAARIDSFVKIVEKGWLDRKNEASKVQATSMEALAGVVKGLTKIEVPSLETIEGLLNDYQHKLNILTKSFNDLGAVIGKLRIVLDAYITILNTYTKQMSAEQKKTLQSLIDASEVSYHALLNKGLGGGGKKQRMDTAKTNMAGWDKKIKAIEEQTSSWTQYVAKGVGLATSLGLSVGAATGEMLELINKAHELTAQLAEAVHDNAVDLIESLSEKLPEALAEAANAPFAVAGEALLVIDAEGIMATVLEKLSEVRA